jgi:LPS sulfotransferase NodH
LRENPEEYFWRGDEPYCKERWGVSDYGDYLIKAIEQGSTSNGVFGAKIMWGYFDDFTGKLKQIPDYRSYDLPSLLQTAFPNLHYIAISRRDKVRQAISFWRVIETGIWAWNSDGPPAPQKDPVYSYTAISHLKEEIYQHEAAWEGFFHAGQIEPHRVVYEELVSDYSNTVLKVLSYLGISIPAEMAIAKPKMNRQADTLTEVWLKAYLREEELKNRSVEGG